MMKRPTMEAMRASAEHTRKAEELEKRLQSEAESLRSGLRCALSEALPSLLAIVALAKREGHDAALKEALNKRTDTVLLAHDKGIRRAPELPQELVLRGIRFVQGACLVEGNRTCESLCENGCVESLASIAKDGRNHLQIRKASLDALLAPICGQSGAAFNRLLSSGRLEQIALVAKSSQERDDFRQFILKQLALLSGMLRVRGAEEQQASLNSRLVKVLGQEAVQAVLGTLQPTSEHNIALSLSQASEKGLSVLHSEPRGICRQS